jgi:hypothetical protein
MHCVSGLHNAEVKVGSPFVLTKRERKWKDSGKMLAGWTEVAS